MVFFRLLGTQRHVLPSFYEKAVFSEHILLLIGLVQFGMQAWLAHMKTIEKGVWKMADEHSKTGTLAMIETYLKMAEAGQEIGLDVKLHKEIIKQSLLTNEADNLRIEKDVYLLIADYIPKASAKDLQIVSKVYAFGSINNTEIEEKTTRLIANERLKIDYDRLRSAGINFQEIQF
jgi:hypothetical protein